MQMLFRKGHMISNPMMQAHTKMQRPLVRSFGKFFLTLICKHTTEGYPSTLPHMPFVDNR